MITEIKNSVTETYGKRNWIDQNNVVFGYYDSQCCCECWGWGVWNPRTKERVADTPNGMPYHFDFKSGATQIEFTDDLPKREYGNLLYGQDATYLDHLDVVRVNLIPDEGVDGDTLVFEAYTSHNGYYLHGFSFEKKERVESVQNSERVNTVGDLIEALKLQPRDAKVCGSVPNGHDEYDCEVKPFWVAHYNDGSKDGLTYVGVDYRHPN